MSKAELTKVEGWLTTSWPSIEEMIPKHVDRVRFRRMLIDQVRNNPELGKCTPESIFRSCVRAANLGLEIDVMNSAYLVRFGKTCTLIPGYAGLIQLARNSGVKGVNVVTMRTNDKAVQHASGRVEASFDPFDLDRGPVVGWVCTVALDEFTNQYTVLILAEYQRLRPTHWEMTPHKTHPEEMGKKTCVRRALKMVPLSPEAREFVAESDRAEYPDVEIKPRNTGGNDAVMEIMEEIAPVE